MISIPYRPCIHILIKFPGSLGLLKDLGVLSLSRWTHFEGGVLLAALTSLGWGRDGLPGAGSCGVGVGLVGLANVGECESSLLFRVS